MYRLLAFFQAATRARPEPDQTMTAHENGANDNNEGSYLELKESLFDALVENLHSRKFLPANEVERFTSKNAVKSALREEGLMGSGDADDLVLYASGRGRLVFLTLVYTENLQALDSLRQDGFNDSHLPVGYVKKKPEKRAPGRKRIMYDIGPLDEVSNTLQPTRWASFSDSQLWSNGTLESFEVDQWQFLAPVFTKGRFKHVFAEQRPLPFLRREGDAKIGFFSRVYQIKIHGAHQQVLVKVITPICDFASTDVSASPV